MAGDAGEAKLTNIPDDNETEYKFEFKDGETVPISEHLFLLSHFLNDMRKTFGVTGSVIPISDYTKDRWDLLQNIINTMKNKNLGNYLQFLNGDDMPQQLKPEYSELFDDDHDKLIDAANLSAYLGLNLTKRIIISRLKDLMTEDPEKNGKLLRATPLDKETCERENIGKTSDIWREFPGLYKKIFNEDLDQ